MPPISMISFLTFYLFIYFWLCWVLIAAQDFSCWVSGGYSLVNGVWASLVAEHRL